MLLSSVLNPVLIQAFRAFPLSLEDVRPLLVRHGLTRPFPSPEDLPRRDAAAQDLIEGARLWSGIEGFTLGSGGIFTLAPHLLSSLRTQMRLIQSIALVYDAFPREDEEKLMVWELLAEGLSGGTSLAAASSGALSNPLAQKIVRRLIRGFLRSLGIRFSSETVTRLVPLLGALLQSAANITLSARIGTLARDYYRGRYLARHGVPSSEKAPRTIDADEL